MLDFEIIYKTVKEYKKNKNPFLLARCGDGEGIFLHFNDERKVRYVSKRQWGFLPREKSLEMIHKNLITAYNEANAIGVPTGYHTKKDSKWRQVIPALEKNVVNFNNKLICSINIHNEWLDNDIYKQLLANQDKIYYISGRNITNPLKNRFKIKEIGYMNVTPEIKFESNKNQERHFPFQFYKAIEWIKRLDCTGCYCLYGAGVLGKYYGYLFKKQGGVALDLGNVFDLWFGKVTRGPRKGVDSYNDKNKL
jgi:hypothetical protein